MQARRLLIASLALAACGQEQERRIEAERVVLVVDQLIAADLRSKAPALDRLRAAACTLPEVCRLRDVCADAFAPVAEGARLQREARELLDRHDPALSADVDRKLDEAERHYADAKKKIDPCLAAATEVRQKHRL